MLITLLLTASAALPASPAPAQNGDDDAIPGLIRIPAGRTHLGLSQKDAEELIQEHPGAAQEFGAQVGNERPSLPEFWLSPTEVTNEMYLRFVEDTGAMPPASWVRLTRDQRLAIIDQLKEENPGAVLDDNTLGRWWEDNWQDPTYEWKVLPEEATMPVGFISHEDARAYCRWAGLRLPTEQEWVRGARADEKDYTYPFGEEFDASLVAHRDAKPRNVAFKVLPVAALANASPFGLYDMSGNLWEWTDTRFDQLEGFEPFVVDTKAGEKPVGPNFDGASFVVRGGSYELPSYACTLDVRYGIQPQYRAPSLGFRVASSVLPGHNAALYALENVRGPMVGGLPERILSVDQVVAVEKRRFVPAAQLEPKRAPAGQGLPSSKLPEGYAVFDHYDSVAVIPYTELNVSGNKMERTVEDEGPVPFGVLHTTVALDGAGSSALPGTYVMMYVPTLDIDTILTLGGTLTGVEAPENWEPEKLDEDEIPITELWPKVEGLPFRPSQGYVLLVDASNEAVAVLEAEEADTMRPRNSDASGIVFDHRDPGAEHLDVRLLVPEAGKRNSSWEFQFSLIPRGKEAPLIELADWDGSFELLEPKEEKRATARRADPND